MLSSYVKVSFCCTGESVLRIILVVTVMNLILRKATPNKFSVSRPGFKHIYMRAGGPFPLFHYKIGSFSNHYFPGTTIKSCIKACLSLFLPF